jgi:signal transduction histidine kinase
MRPIHRWLPNRWLRLPRRTVRLRLTVVYGGLFLLSGAALLAITYFLVSAQVPAGAVVSGQTRAPATGPAGSLPGGYLPAGAVGGTGPIVAGPGQADQKSVFLSTGSGGCHLSTGPSFSSDQLATQTKRCLAEQRHAVLNQLLTESGVALGIMLLVSIGLGWLVAGRVLRKLRTITAAARSVSASSLHARLDLAGPDDELKELGDTFDALLARLEAAFGAQRQFVANASHELRTPLARQRTLIEVALADPQQSIDALQDVCKRVLATGEQQERLIEALLTLARSQRGLDRREPVDLAALTGEVVLARQAEAGRRGLAVASRLGPAAALGDARLADRLVTNLVDNALRHNTPHGTVELVTGTWAGHAVLSVCNTGPVIDPDRVGRLFQPFQRSDSYRAGSRDGLGLGLSIVAAIAEAHGAWLQANALAGGGLGIQVGFPVAACAPVATPGSQINGI